MSFRATTLRRLIIVALLLVKLSGNSTAQDNGPVFSFAKVDPVTSTLVKAVNNDQNGSTSSPTDDQWLMVEFKYSVNLPKDRYLDQIQFKVWVEGRDMLDPQGQSGQGIAVALTGSVTYANVGKGDEMYGVVYLHPSTLARYSTPSGGVNDFDRKFDVHVEADITGMSPVGVDKNKEEDPNWYQALRTIPGLVYRQNQCPFINDNPDRYPAIKLPDSSSN